MNLLALLLTLLILPLFSSYILVVYKGTFPLHIILSIKKKLCFDVHCMHEQMSAITARLQSASVKLTISKDLAHV